MPLLSMKDVSVVYSNNGKKVRAVDSVSLDVEEQDSVGIVGESGSGKSTLITAVLRLLGPNAKVDGRVLFEGSDILSLNKNDFNALRWKKIAVVFQKSMNALSPVHRIGYQMGDIYRVHEPQASKTEVRDHVLELLKMVNLPERVYRAYPHELSGGMMQRVSIALSLMHNPRLLIMDEATTALDVITQGQILDNIMQLQEQLHLTRLMITHDMSVVSATCKKIVVMYAGRFMETGPVEDVMVNPMHPYTKGLLASFPSLTSEVGSISGIPGSIPDLSKPIEGCVFAPRCPYASDICRKVRPQMRRHDHGRMVACHLYNEEAEDHVRGN